MVSRLSPPNVDPLFPNVLDSIFGDMIRNINYRKREPPAAVDGELVITHSWLHTDASLADL